MVSPVFWFLKIATFLSLNRKNNYFLDFNESPSFFNTNVSSFAFASDEAVSLVEMSAESVVGIDNSESACIPTDFTVLSVPVPQRFGNKEVVVFDLSSER